MSYTFGDQLDKLSSLLGDPNTSTDDMFPLTQRKKEINRGEVNFAVDSLNLKEYATGTVSSNQIAVPSDWIQTFVLIIDNKVITNDREISLVDWERYSSTSDARPFYYFWNFSGTMYMKFIGTVSGLTYYLYYFKKPTTELSATTDVSLHHEEYREASVYYAASELMRQIGKTSQALEFRQVYEAMAIRARSISDKEYIRKEYARPDFGQDIDIISTDIQGRGYIG